MKRDTQKKRRLSWLHVDVDIKERFKKAVQERGLKLQSGTEQALLLWLAKNGVAV